MDKKTRKNRVEHLEKLGYNLELVSGMIQDIKDTIQGEITFTENVRLYNVCDSLKRTMDSVDKIYGWLHEEYLRYLSKFIEEKEE